MAYSIELYFDTDFEVKIRRLWSNLNEHNIPSIMHRIGSRPHLALSILDFIKEKEIPNIIQYLSKNFRQFEIEFPALSIIPGESQAVFLSPTSNVQLIEMHHSLYDYLLEKKYSPKEFYKPGKWLPHCTISKELSFEETLETFKVCGNCPITGKAIVSEVGIIEFRPRKELGTCRLNAT